ncbi:MAG: hypothetical protein ACE5HF_10615 [Gemmatimonadota bacterium]
MSPAARAEAIAAVRGSCVRFRKLDDLPLELIGDSIAELEPQTFIERCGAARAGRGGRKR